MAGTYEQEKIAQYIRELLDKTKKLQDEINVIKREKKNVFGPPPLPFAGIFPALDAQHHDVVKITYTKASSNYWEGYLCKPIEAAPFWEPDTQLGTISGVTPDMVSVPEVDEIVEVFFSGMYADDDGELQPQYGMFDAADVRPGVTTASKYPYPQDPATNVYEVQTYRGSFPKQPGKQELTTQDKDVVIAMNWVNNPVLLSQGTRVSVHRHNGQWFFRQRSNTIISTTSSSYCTITVVVSAYCACGCCSPTYVQTCTYTNTYTSASSCSSSWDPFLETYIASCSIVTSVTTITSCSTYLSTSSGNCYITATYTIGAGCSR